MRRGGAKCAPVPDDAHRTRVLHCVAHKQGELMDDLVKTGITGLDEVLHGGIPRNNNLIVEGPPGSGKTTLGLGFIYHGALDYDEPGAIVSFELDPAKLLRDAAGFNWDLQGLIDQGKIKIIQ